MQAAFRTFASLARSSSSSIAPGTSIASTIMARKQIPIPTGPFPSNGLLPKDETQAASFQKRCPEYDGRGIRVAVLDTGVDPAAFGLNGKNKIVDIIDCSGSGDIPLKPVEPLATKTGNTSSSSSAVHLPGLSGRTLLVSSSWTNPTKEWKVGLKRAFELWPADLVRRRKSERKQAWDVKLAGMRSMAKKELDMFERSEKEKTESKGTHATADNKEGTEVKSTDKTKDAQIAAKEDAPEPKKDKSAFKAKKTELEARIAYLNDFDLEDPGPVLDIVVWNDGTDWRAVVGGAEGDGSEQNIAPSASSEGESEPTILDLTALKPMTDFRKEKHYERFGQQDLLSYSVNIYDEGQILSLTCASGTHGSHCASIIGSNVPDQPELNGVAPGVEIVSLTIGDNRLNALETHQALMRATKAILDTECDICNMSFGEDAAWGMENRGQFVSMLRDEVIKKRNVIFVTAAGNSGPALSTIGAPATTSGLVCVGAYETPSMQNAEYAMLENVPAGPYTWSSRGPTYDGEQVSTWAPGAAIAGTNAYALQHTQLMNGTSMASPNACGGISLVLSALKAEGIAYTPARILQALKATGKPVDDPQPVGFIQIEALYNYLVEHKDAVDFDADFDISITSQGRQAPDFSKALGEREGMRGVYLREKVETSRLYEAACFVKPSFATRKETEKLYNLDMKLALAATEPWVRAPNFVSLASAGRTFDIRVDPTHLPPGLHCAEIRAYDTKTPGRQIFSIPITVCKPEIVTSPSHTIKEIHSAPGSIDRRFLAVPEGATWAELRLTTRNHAAPINLWIHCIQLQPEVRLSHVDNQFILSCTAGETVSKTFTVASGVTMELCTSQFWKSLPSADVSMEIHFHGLTLDSGKELTIVGGGELPRLQVNSKIRLEQFSPSVSFDRRRSMLRPTESKITPLGERDVMPDGKRLYQLVNNYTFKLSDKTKIKPFFAITDNLYDSAFAVLTQILDTRKQVVQWGSVYANEVELGKGDYTLLLQVEHSDYKVLEANKGLALGLEAQLGEKSKKLSLAVQRDHIDATTKPDSNAFKNIMMPLGETRPLVINTDLKGDVADLYKSAKAGDILLGKLSLGPGSSKACFDLTYVIPPKAKSEESEDDDKDTPLLVDLQLGIVDKIKDDKEKKAFLDSLAAANPTHLPLLVAVLKNLKEDAEPKEISKAAEAVLAQIDESQLAIHLGKKPVPAEEETEEVKKAVKDMDERKVAWGAAYSRLIEVSYKNGDTLERQNSLFAKYRQFIESPDKDQDFSLISAKRDFAQQRYGACLTTVKKLLDESLAKDKYKEVTELERNCLNELGWSTLTELSLRWKLVREPVVEAVW